MSLEVDSDEQAKLLVEWLTVVNECVKCKVLFKEINNIGFWRCSQHTAVSVNGIYPCCGRKISIVGSTTINNGCVPADHNSQSKCPYTRINNVEIPAPIIKKWFDVSKLKGIIVEEFEERRKKRQTGVKIARYDYKSKYNDIPIILNVF